MTLLTSPDAIEAVSSRLALENQLYAKLNAQTQLEQDLNALSAASEPSEVYQLLNPYPPEPLAFGMMQPNQSDWRVEKIGDYLTHLMRVQPLVTGENLIQRGLKPSRGVLRFAVEGIRRAAKWTSINRTGDLPTSGY